MGMFVCALHHTGMSVPWHDKYLSIHPTNIPVWLSAPLNRSSLGKKFYFSWYSNVSDADCIDVRMSQSNLQHLYIKTESKLRCLRQYFSFLFLVFWIAAAAAAVVVRNKLLFMLCVGLFHTCKIFNCVRLSLITHTWVCRRSKHCRATHKVMLRNDENEIETYKNLKRLFISCFAWIESVLFAKQKKIRSGKRKRRISKKRAFFVPKWNRYNAIFWFLIYHVLHQNPFTSFSLSLSFVPSPAKQFISILHHIYYDYSIAWIN